MVGIDIDSQRRVFAGRLPVGGDRLPLGVEGDGYGLYLPWPYLPWLHSVRLHLVRLPLSMATLNWLHLVLRMPVHISWQHRWKTNKC